MQDALTGATDKLTTTREVNGQKFYDYEVLGPVRLYCWRGEGWGWRQWNH